MSEKQRIIQEFVPGKQVTLAHVVANPDARLYPKIGLPPGGGAIGVLTITPSEGTVIAADVATKAAAVELGFVDRFARRRGCLDCLRRHISRLVQVCNGHR
jgi:ethanolamine utilization protein EutS